MCRAVSGAAVYVSDKPGQHDFELLRSLVLADGSTLRWVTSSLAIMVAAVVVVVVVVVVVMGML
eukprot:1136435-Pelagomonas_calceolata.AAC.2